MTGLIANIVLNALLVGLLAATIIYCYVLNKRIKTLQDSKSELAGLLTQFDESTVKASETIIALQTASKKIGDNIQMRIDKANYLLEDLSYAIDKGTRLSSQIEASFAVNRARNMADHAATTTVDDMVGGGHEPHADIAEKQARNPNPKREQPSIEAIVEKVVARTGKSPAKPATSGRSRAEQELIELIRSAKG